ncbi:MAG: tetratricopeptide repeat protein [Polyangiales bacterium]
MNSCSSPSRRTPEHKSITSKVIGLAALALGLAHASDAEASGKCPTGTWWSKGSCCELGNEYVASKNQCMPVRPERRCIEGHYDDCVSAGRQLEQRGSIGAGYAAELYKFACEEGHAPACRGLGGLHDRGLGVDKDESRGRALYEQACAGGDAPACTLLAEKLLAEQPDGAPQQGGRALSLFVQACHRGDPYACDEYGQQLSRKPEQLRQSATYFERACVGGVGNACLTLLERARDERAVDADRVQELLDRACRAGEAQSCVELGDALREGMTAPPSTSQAALRYRTACEAGQLSGCMRLAELTAVGDGVTQDLRRASELYGRVCGAGLQLACERASSLATEPRR